MVGRRMRKTRREARATICEKGSPFHEMVARPSGQSNTVTCPHSAPPRAGTHDAPTFLIPVAEWGDVGAVENDLENCGHVTLLGRIPENVNWWDVAPVKNWWGVAHVALRTGRRPPFFCRQRHRPHISAN